MERTMYYNYPQQVLFYNFNGKESKYNAGIAYCGEIISGYWGIILSIEDIYQRADEENLLNPIIELNWVNISDEIQGDYESPVPIFKMESKSNKV